MPAVPVGTPGLKRSNASCGPLCYSIAVKQNAPGIDDVYAKKPVKSSRTSAELVERAGTMLLTPYRTPSLYAAGTPGLATTVGAEENAGENVNV